MSIHTLAILQGLILISAANMAPVICERVWGTRFAGPIDGGLVLRDGHPLLGPSKTWRGVVAAIVLASCAAVLIGPSTASRGACRRLRHGRRLRLVLHQTADRARVEQYVTRSRSDSRSALARNRMPNLHAARLCRHHRDHGRVLRRTTGAVEALLRDRLARPTLLSLAEHEPVQGDFRPIVETHRNERRSRSH